MREASPPLETRRAVASPARFPLANDDAQEREADRNARELVGNRATRVNVQRRCSCGGTCPTCTGNVQRKAIGNATTDRTAVPQSVATGLDSPAQPLDTETRAFFEPRLQHDLSNVRVHAGASAAASAAAVHAQAYTVGRDLVFGEGRYDPQSHSGRELLAHELTHVVQQSAAGGPRLQRRVVDSDESLPCRAAPGRDAKTLRALELQAAALAMDAATALRAEPLREDVRKAIWKRMHRDANDSLVRCHLIPELAERFERIAKALRDDYIRYVCSTTGEPEMFCGKRMAKAWPLLSHTITLCSLFWSKEADAEEQALTLLHECMHLYFGTRDIVDGTAGGFGRADCYPQFARDLAIPDRAFLVGNQCQVNLDPLPERDPDRLVAPCRSNVFSTLSLSGSYATSLPGVGRSATQGVGVDLELPLTRMHDWELALGGRFQQFLPLGAEKQKAYLLGVRTGINYRIQPWSFDLQFGVHLEAGSIDLPGGPGRDSRQQSYGQAGGSIGLIFPLSSEKALKLMSEASLAYDLPVAGDQHLSWFQAGLSLGIQNR